MSSEDNVNIEPHVGFRTCNNILDKWGCTPFQKMAMLGMTEDDFLAYQHYSESSPLTNEQLERLSYILNIHFELKMIFSNYENIYGFMSMKNTTSYFNGQTPTSLIETGDLAVLGRVFLEIKNIRSH